MTGKYAQGTEVPIGRSRDEIERTLERFGATSQLWGRDDQVGRVTVAFKREGRAYKFTVDSPRIEDFQRTPTGRDRAQSYAAQARDAEARRRFRSLANYLKAVLDAIDTGIIIAEEALLPYLLLPSGETVFQQSERQLQGGMNVDLARSLQEGQQVR